MTSDPNVEGPVQQNPYTYTTEAHIAGLRWKDFSQKERWIVFWGVTWRGLIVYLGLILLYAFFAYGFRNGVGL